MERDVAISLIRGLEWPSEITVYCRDNQTHQGDSALGGIISGELLGFENARHMRIKGLADWEPAAIMIQNATWMRSDGYVATGGTARVPFGSIVRIETP